MQQLRRPSLSHSESTQSYRINRHSQIWFSERSVVRSNYNCLLFKIPCQLEMFCHCPVGNTETSTWMCPIVIQVNILRPSEFANGFCAIFHRDICTRKCTVNQPAYSLILHTDSLETGHKSTQIRSWQSVLMLDSERHTSISPPHPAAEIYKISGSRRLQITQRPGAFAV